MKGNLRQPLVMASLWLLLVTAVIVGALNKGPVFDTSVMALLPESQQDPRVERAIERVAADFSERIVIILSASDRELARNAVFSAAKSLDSLRDSAELIWRDDSQESIVDQLYPYRFINLPDQVAERLASGNFQHQQQLALQRIFSPLSGVRVDPINDPFTLQAEQVMAFRSGFHISPEQGLLRLTEAQLPSYLITLKLNSDPFSLPVQQKILSVLTPLEQELESQGIQVSRSGLLWHAVAGAEQAEAEISLIGLGSLAGIVLLILSVFRSISPLWIVLLPVTVGCVMALSVTLLLFGRIHLITIAFGAGLVGVSVDYAMHYICERRIRPGPGLVRHLFMGLLLGLLSSVIAYAGLALAPFPGLRQMAVFSVVGLIAAWLTVLLWLPVIRGNHTPEPLAAATVLQRWRNRYPALEGRPYLIMALLLLCLSSALIVWWAEPRDSIRLLQTSPEQLLAKDQEVQQLLGSNTSAQFLLVTGDSLDSAIQTEERLRQGLDKLVQEGELPAYSSLSQTLPSQQRQVENAALTRELYKQQMAGFAGVVRFSEQQEQAALSAMNTGSSIRLSAEAWQEQPLSQLWRQFIIDDSTGNAATVIRLQGSVTPLGNQHLQRLANSNSDVFFVDRIENINSVLGTYREQITGWLLIAYSLVALILLWRYRTDFWRILLPPLIASLVTFACVVLLNGGYNLFNLIALMLVLGIGLDMGIFLYESSDSDHTWLAVTLSASTSLLAFGLLTLSKTPVLYHFGIVILPGLLLVWLMAPLMRTKTTGDINEHSTWKL